MTKIVYNGCFGGFSLSAAGLKRWAELKGRECYFFINGRDANGGLRLNKRVPVSVEDADKEFMFHAYDIPNPDEVLPSQDNWGELSMEEKRASNAAHEKHSISSREIPRADRDLVRVVEELGAAANGSCAELKIAEVPAGTKYRIDEYDGSESVMTIDDYEWETA